MPIKVAIPCPVSELKKDLQIQNLLNEETPLVSPGCGSCLSEVVQLRAGR